jgi:hypothetical protein
MPGRRGGAAGSPQGGRVSVELGGTVAQVTQRTEARVAALTDRVAARPAIAGKAGGGSEPERLVSIIGGNLLGSGAYGIKFVSALPTVDKFYDPDVDTTFPDGLGYATYYVDGVLEPENVIVIHDWTIYRAPLISGLVLPVRGTMTIPITPTPVTGPTTITVYRVGVYRS